jgi:hypothetical protein
MERERIMAKQCCATCIYAYWNRRSWLRTIGSGFPARPLCANHPDTPGQLREVAPGGLCRNYRPKPAATEGDIKRIPLGDSQYALVNAADYEWLSRWAWRLDGGYAVRWEKDKRIYMHREIMQPPQEMVVDHINRNRLDNCQANLRVCTRNENTYNRRKRSGSYSQFKGVGYRKNRGKWFAEVRFEGKPIWLGFFDDEVEAARAYDRKAVELFGEFARLNFPEEGPPEKRQEVYANRQVETDAQKGKGKEAKRKSTGPRTKTPARRTTQRKGKSKQRRL